MAAPEVAFFGAAITVGLSGAVGYGLYRILGKNGPPETAIDFGRKWLAWMVFVGTLSTLPSFFLHLDVDSFAQWLVVVVFFGGIAFAGGWIYGKFVSFSAVSRSESLSSDVDRGATAREDSAAPRPLVTQLTELKDVLDKGLISHQQYEVARTAILSSLSASAASETSVTPPSEGGKVSPPRTNLKQQLMADFGITHDGHHFCVQGHEFDKLSDAIDYAKLQS